MCLLTHTRRMRKTMVQGARDAMSMSADAMSMSADPSKDSSKAAKAAANLSKGAARGGKEMKRMMTRMIELEHAIHEVGKQPELEVAPARVARDPSPEETRPPASVPALA